ncbi:thyrotropin-releasing hormone-degrading ectoenzyme-like isoform X2 [Odontomachus brunneus]|uniref:thyrotropin-releasing hormone-degrading ectoenzyme-like isoform X2 n=1 Tax=Odontomachus brunneus TaxID=486640 RepID=UPI0013F2208F|nr:thyrotropin-releasing hormone-degrading ectoenzyme-like isoform X2 [Odontomachus brunneus]XP_032687703.1 thyrotropin-releasing hormone-degrading ectoenzyme-like isoform X2 [Odontomachus brunneus]XP_032687704.1 thyrotropin-releasing hormone-degrading ectoenzyme-like isoform X2 [Odontomachus brunneus]
MCTTCLKQILYVVLILNIAMAIKTDVDYGNCENVSSDEHIPVTIIEPIYYRLYLHLLNPFIESEMYGESNIVIHVHKPTIKLSLHCFGLDIHQDNISLYSITKYYPSSYRFCTKTQILDMFFKETILPGRYNLNIFFVCSYHKKPGNIIRYHYMTYAAETTKRWFFGILSASNRARIIFPCWDEPEIYMQHEIIIRHAEQYQVISNTPVKKLLNEPNNMSLTFFHTTKPIVSSQVAVILFNNMIQRRWYEEYFWHHMVEERNIFREIWDMKLFLANYLKVRDRIMKTDHFVIPNLPYQVAGSLGVITYREESIKYNKSIDFPGREINIFKMVGEALAREVLVEVICASYYTLIKIFASFFSHFVIFQDSIYLSFMDLSIVQTVQGALYYDVDFQMAPVSQNKFLFPIDEIDAIHYSRLYYNKGAALMRMFLYSLEKPEYFDLYISKLVNECEDTLTFKDLWTIMSSVLTEDEELDDNITEMMYTWITQRHFPEVKVYRNYTHNYAILSAYNCNEIKRKIPIIYTTISDFTYVYGESKIILFDCSKFKKNEVYVHKLDVFDIIIVNVKQVGYYRVNYDSQTWQRIVTLLNYNNFTLIDVVNRAQLIDDAYYFVMNDKLEVSTFTHLIKYLKRERHYVAWYPMFNILMYMSKYFELPESARFKSFVLEILDSLLQKVGYDELTEDNDMTKSLRLLGLKWACKLGHTVCKTTATSKLSLSLQNSFTILPWWKEWVYCAGMMEADPNVGFKVFFVDDGMFDQKLLMYLTCSENEHILVAYLDNLWSLQLENLKLTYCLDLVEGYEMIIAAYRSFVKKHARKNAVLKHILENYDKLPSTILGSKSPVTVLGITILELYSEDNFKQITAFVKSPRNFTMEEKSIIEIFVKRRKIELERISHNFRMF